LGKDQGLFYLSAVIFAGLSYTVGALQKVDAKHDCRFTYLFAKESYQLWLE
jgi:hypothetical protein